MRSTAIPKTRLRRRSMCRSANDIKRHYTTGRVDVQLGQQHRAVRARRRSTTGSRSTSASASATRAVERLQPAVEEHRPVGWRDVGDQRSAGARDPRRLLEDRQQAGVELDAAAATRFPSIMIGSPTNSPQWWKEINVQFNNSLSYFVPSWHGEHSLQARASSSSSRSTRARSRAPSRGARLHVRDRSARLRTIPSTYPAPTRYSIVLGDSAYKILNSTYARVLQGRLAALVEADAESRRPLRRRDRHASTPICRTRSSPARSAATTTTSRRALASPTTCAATGARSCAAAGDATSTRCC